MSSTHHSEDEEHHVRLDENHRAIATLLDSMIANQQRMLGLLSQLVVRMRDRGELLKFRSGNGNTLQPGLADKDQMARMTLLTRQWCVRELALLEDLLATTNPPS